MDLYILEFGDHDNPNETFVEVYLTEDKAIEGATVFLKDTCETMGLEVGVDASIEVKRTSKRQIRISLLDDTAPDGTLEWYFITRREAR